MGESAGEQERFVKCAWFFCLLMAALGLGAACGAASPAPHFQGIPCSYTLPADSDVTLAVFDRQGHLLQTLLKDVPRHAGRNVVDWNGKDQYGKSVPPGVYQLRGLWHPPIETHSVMTLDNPGTPPWPTVNGRGDWLSDEASPQAAVTDGTTVYLAAPGSEKGTAIIGVGPDGRRLWGFQESTYPRCVSLALDGQYLYALFSGPVLTDASNRFNGQNAIGRAFLVCLDKTTGAPAQFSLQHSHLRVATWPYVDHTAGLWNMRVQQTFTPETYEGQTRYFANDVGEPTEAVGIAAAGGKLYVSMLSENQLLVLDAASGKQTGTLSLPHPVGLHALADGQILAVSDGRIVRIQPATGAVSAVITQNLDAPHDVTADAKGQIYVSDWSKSFQVKVFSPQGVFLRAIGIKGGRPWIGTWNAQGMLLPRGIAVTNSGELWVAEDDASPSRVSVWNARTGAFLRDYLGPAPYGGGAAFWVDPQDPNLVLAAGTLWRINRTKKTARPVSTPFRRMSLNEPFTPAGMSGPSVGERALVHAGKQYLFVTTSPYSMLVLRRDGNRLVPAAAMGCRGRYITSDGTDQPVWDSDIGTHYIAGMFPDFFRGHVGDNYVWTDTNGDGQVQPSEMQWVPTLPRGNRYAPGRQLEAMVNWTFGIGPDGAIYFSGFCRNRSVVYRMDITGWTASGAPRYDLADAKPILVGRMPVQGLSVSDDNRLYVARPYEGGSTARDALDCYTRDGHLLWALAKPPSGQQAKDVLADTVMGEYHIPSVGGIIATWLWHGNYKPYLLTSDGLYITSLLDETRLGPKADWDESYRTVFQTSRGTPYLVNGGNDAFHFLQITGLHQIRRFQSPLRITPSEAQAAAALPDASPEAFVAAPPVIHVHFAAIPPRLNGGLSGWDFRDAVSLQGSRGRSAQVALARDAQTLYLAYRVRGARFVNKGGDWQTLFISGDCVDLMLTTTPGKQHFVPEAGDERLLLSIFQGKPIAVLYRPVVPSASAPVKLMGAVIDQITRVRSAQIAVQRSTGGYTLEAAVPLAALHLSPATSDTLRGDVGVIYADATGANRSLRLYYYNHETGMTADLTTEATLQPGDWGKIEFPLGLNLLQDPSFEQTLSAVPTAGWAVGSQRVATATITPGDAYAGQHSLCLRQTGPTVFPPESYTNADYGQFIRSANGGQGGAAASVTQQVPVIGGQSYDLRLHFRAQDMQGEIKAPGHPRGYDSLEVWIYWIGSNHQNLRASWVTNIQSDQLVWKTLRDSRANYQGLATPFLAPPGATAAVISLSLAGNAAGHLPTVWIDDVQFAAHPAPGIMEEKPTAR